MSEQPKGAMWQAILAGVVVLMGTGPLALALMVVSTRGMEGLARTIQEGGIWSYGVLLAGGLASVAASMLAALSVRNPGFPPTAAAAPFAFSSLVGLLGALSGLSGLLDALAHVSAADRAIILIAGSGELLALPQQALAFAAAGLMMVSIASLVSVNAPHVVARVTTLLAAGSLGVGLMATLLQLSGLRSGFSMMGMSSPADRALIVASGIEDWMRFRGAASVLVIGSALIALAGGVALAVRGQRAAGIGTAAAFLVALVGVRGFDALALSKVLAAHRDASPVEAPSRMVVDGEGMRAEPLVLESEESATRQVAREVARRPEAHLVGLELRPETSRAMLLRAFVVAHYLKAEVELVGDPPERVGAALPPQFEPLMKLMRTPRAVPLRILFEDEACERCDGKGTATATGLKVGDAEWTSDMPSIGGEVDEARGVEFDWGTGSIDTLVKAALAASRNDRVLTVRIPAPATPPELPEP